MVLWSLMTQLDERVHDFVSDLRVLKCLRKEEKYTLYIVLTILTEFPSRARIA